MRTKTTFRALIGTLLVLTAAVCSMTAQQALAHADAASRSAPAKQKQGLVEFALQGINPSDRNYGACLDDVRKLAIQQTLGRLFFWSNLVAVAVAVCLLLVVVHQQRLLNRRELMAAECMTQLRNALSRAEDQTIEATRRNHALMQALSASSLASPSNTTPIVEHVEQPKPRKVVTTSTPASSTATTPPTLTTPATPATSSASKKSPEPRPVSQPSSIAVPAAPESRTGSQLGLFGSDGDFVAKINTLQQQLSTSQERERHLRRQLNDSEIRFQKEREKSRSLQG